MSKRQLVGRMPSKELDILAVFFKKARKNPIWIERLEKMLKGRNPFEQIKEAVKVAKNWLQSIVDRERECHQNFFGGKFALAEFTKTLKKYGAEKVDPWKKLGLEPHFLPAISLSQDSNLPGWKIKPEPWFWSKIKEGEIMRFEIMRLIKDKLAADQTAGDLEGVTVLVDTRLKPEYGDEYKDDWLGQIIFGLRKAGKIEDFNSRSSRFNISAEETELIKVEAAKILGLKPDQLRLEREIEANVIPQLYPYMPRKDDGKTNTWEWREEFFKDRGDRLIGGHSDNGGLANVLYYLVSYHWYYRAFRFLAVL